MEYKTFKKNIIKSMERHEFSSFDKFIINEMGYKVGEAEEAWKEFRKRTENMQFASVPTMRRWFGLNGKASPSRENIFEICFKLGCDMTDVERYLTKGIHEPAFQSNDYVEMAYMYCIENHLSYETALDIIDRYEKEVGPDVEFSHTHTTLELLTQYNTSKFLTIDEFVTWMQSKSEWFKGYSKTAMDYLILYRTSIINNIREEAREYFRNMFSERGFEKWKKKRPLKNDEEFYSAVKKYINRKDKSGTYVISEQERMSILEMAKLAFSGRETNTQMLAEVFNSTDSFIDIPRGIRYPGIRKMTDKYLSDLFNIPFKREARIKLMLALKELESTDETEVCPDHIIEICSYYTKPIRSELNSNEYINKSADGQVVTVGDIKKLIIDYNKENKRRTLLIQRTDLLPLIYHFSQQRYIRENGNDYNMDSARAMFVDLADKTLNACNMEGFNTDYELDFVLYESFCEDEMFSYSEVLDALYG